MSDNSKIEWTTNTFNPWWGCSRVSPACRFCYADRDATRYGHELWRRHGERRMLSEANWARPLKWNRDAERAGVPVKVFCASMADVFEDHPALTEPRQRLWGVIESTPWLRWQILTKRPENVAGMAPWGDVWPDHVWLGTSVENQRYASERIRHLLDVPAKVRFLSCEPLLGPVNLWQWLDPSDPCVDCDVCGEERFADEIGQGHDRIALYCGERHPDNSPEGGAGWCPGPSAGAVPRRIDWVIAGGESGPKARASHPGWFRSLRDQCMHADVPFLFKQWGEWSERGNPDWPLGDAWKNPQRHRWVSPDDGKVKPFGEFTGNGDMGWAHVKRVGKKAAGRDLDGREWSEFPASEPASIA
jgi:protein gp37